MKTHRFFFFLFMVFSYICLYASDPFRLNGNRGSISTVFIGKHYKSSETICPFRSGRSITGLCINGKINKESDEYLVRIVLIDTKGDEYLLLESYDLINNNPEICLDNYCEETALLGGVIPKEIKIIVNHATLEINSFGYIEDRDGDSHNEDFLLRERNDIRKKQICRIVDNINAYNIEHKKLWIAVQTELSLLSWKERKRVMGLKSDDCYTWGFEYYGGGIIDIGFPKKEDGNGKIRTRSSNSSFVSSFDWRNRHGINWMTPIRNQISDGACWAFTAVGVVEAVANLYYNQKIDFDLSEQEVISCTDNSIGTIQNGGFSWKALGWIAENGVSNEEAFPYSNTDEPCSNKGIATECVFINDTVPVLHYYNNPDTVKKYLIEKGPMASGIRYWYYSPYLHTYVANGGHAMVLTGYNEIVADSVIGLINKDSISNYSIPDSSPLEGENYWIFKNSLNTGFLNSHNGYAYVYFYDDDCFRMPYYIKTPIYSSHYTFSDIACVDRDGDGYYTWGLGLNPYNHYPWALSGPDGDDSNPDYGPLDQTGAPTLIDYTSQSMITGSTSYSNTVISSDTVIMPGATLTITGTVTLDTNVNLTVRPSGTLIIDGGTLQNAYLLLNSGCHVYVNNGGQIVMRSGRPFNYPKGSDIHISNGHIQ